MIDTILASPALARPAFAVRDQPIPTALDLNECPIGPSPKAIERLVRGVHSLHRYPRGLHERVCERVAAHFGAPHRRVLLTRGVDETIDLLLALAAEVSCVVPGFDGYWHRAAVAGKPIREIPLDPFTWQPAVSRCESAGAPDVHDLVLLAQPNNPTGNLFPRSWVLDVAGRARMSCVDETYLEFAGAPSYVDFVGEIPGLCVFKSFSKAYGLAGLRVGALLVPDELADRLARMQRFYPVDALALQALEGALEDTGHRERLRAYLGSARVRYLAVLGASPVVDEVTDTVTNFVLARCADGYRTATVVEGLAGNGVLVRDCGALGLPGWIRVGLGSAADLTRLAEALAGVAERDAPHRNGTGATRTDVEVRPCRTTDARSGSVSYRNSTISD